jgi:hypothetical protein
VSQVGTITKEELSNRQASHLLVPLRGESFRSEAEDVASACSKSVGF